MNTSEWISRSVSKLLPGSKPEPKRPGATVAREPASPKATPGGAGAPAGARGEARERSRSTRERLAATLRQKDEALSPRVLRRLGLLRVGHELLAHQ
jgi:malonyl-CoA decarboxylase